MSHDSPRSPSPNPESDSKKRKALPELEVDLELPEPPSKKAKRALKKGKPLPASKNLSAGDDNEDETVGGSKEWKKKKEARSQHGVWIGNLPFTMTRPELFQWLVDNSGGSIKAEQILRVNLPASKFPVRPAPGEAPSGQKKMQNKGFAYVDFDSFGANVAAIALSETEIEGRKLLIKDSKSFEGRPKKPTPDAAAKEDKNDEPTSRKIFVGNLAYNVTEDDLWAHFEKCGEIDWVKVATFEDSGKCKGYGWVKFRESEAVGWAVKGFVKIKEAASDDEEDGEAEDDREGEQEETAKKADANGELDDAADGEAEEEEQAKKEKPRTKPQHQKKFKTRKWWVNRLKGRELKIQFAEDDKVRYQKRYGKKGTGQGKDGVRKDAASSQAGGEGASDPAEEPKAPKTEKPAKFYEDIDIARRTGAVVAPQGKKTMFE